jgi:hypothetical protein
MLMILNEFIEEIIVNDKYIVWNRIKPIKKYLKSDKKHINIIKFNELILLNLMN